MKNNMMEKTGERKNGNVVKKEIPFPGIPATADGSGFTWGGMENQTLTTFCAGCWSENLTSHEFAHQKYEIEFDGTNYPSGIYFYKIEAGSYTATSRMVLLK